MVRAVERNQKTLKYAKRAATIQQASKYACIHARTHHLSMLIVTFVCFGFYYISCFVWLSHHSYQSRGLRTRFVHHHLPACPPAWCFATAEDVYNVLSVYSFFSLYILFYKTWSPIQSCKQQPWTIEMSRRRMRGGLGRGIPVKR